METRNPYSGQQMIVASPALANPGWINWSSAVGLRPMSATGHA